MCGRTRIGARPVVTLPVIKRHLACYVVVSSLAAISCHRVLLLGPVSVPKFGVGQLGARELRFLATLLFLCFGAGLLQQIGDTATRSLSGIGDDQGERRSFTLYMLGSLPGWYLFSRLALMLPSIAIETRVRIAEAVFLPLEIALLSVSYRQLVE